jgi:hypothetical protein
VVCRRAVDSRTPAVPRKKKLLRRALLLGAELLNVVRPLMYGSACNTNTSEDKIMIGRGCYRTLQNEVHDTRMNVYNASATLVLIDSRTRMRSLLVDPRLSMFSGIVELGGSATRGFGGNVIVVATSFRSRGDMLCTISRKRLYIHMHALTNYPYANGHAAVVTAALWQPNVHHASYMHVCTCCRRWQRAGPA